MLIVPDKGFGGLKLYIKDDVGDLQGTYHGNLVWNSYDLVEKRISWGFGRILIVPHWRFESCDHFLAGRKFDLIH